MIKAFKENDEKNRSNELREIIGCIAKSEKSYKYKNSKAAKHFIADELGISKTQAKDAMIPVWHMFSNDLNANCYYNFNNEDDFKEIVNFIAAKIIEHKVKGFETKESVIEYFYGDLSVFD